MCDRAIRTTTTTVWTDGDDNEPFNQFACSTTWILDTCDDCSSGYGSTQANDGHGHRFGRRCAMLGDPDDDNDGVDRR